ncbi:hypothetical protein I551_5022 [Mycobacterium ulcerans str. Harvey]|uniref:Uncharacterized protein n=1 Tax=Mycobacterium ulcerans str. Harvey TaxID=1299332 RepID=A0ABP3AB14_MYCUL|nr:hypothetical protein I551_5022 [Mycobacterium ulcerans str. Harvey]
MTTTKRRSLTIIGGAYVVAVGVGATWLAWGPTTGRLWLDTLAADVLATLVVFAFSRAYHNSSFYDAYWSVVPPLLALYWWAHAGSSADRLRCWLITIVIWVWTVRLTANWVRGFAGYTTRTGATPCCGSVLAAGNSPSIWWRYTSYPPGKCSRACCPPMSASPAPAPAFAG